MRRVMRKYIFFLVILLGFSSLTSAHLVQSLARAQSSTKTIASYGRITSEPNGLVLKYATDFEDTIKVDDHHLNLPIEHRFNFAGTLADGLWHSGEDGARFWVETDFAHSGTRSIGMELFDITKARRNEFNIAKANELLGEEIMVSVWLFLPSDWMLYAPGSGNRWYEFMNPYAEGGPDWVPKMHFHIYQPIENQPAFSMGVLMRDKDNVKSMPLYVSDFPLPRGRWFNVRFYLLRHHTDGIIKIWFDGKLVGNKTGLVTKDENSYTLIVAKIYHDLTDSVPHKIWVDDLELWSGG